MHITLRQHLKGKPLAYLIEEIAIATKKISHHISRAALTNELGDTNTHNIYGDLQQKLDIYAHELLTKTLQNSGQVCAIASEESPGPITTNQCGEYVCCIDPLDGSSNIDVNVSIGTIFSIFKRITKDTCFTDMNDILQCGQNQVAAGYVIYGSSTTLVYTIGEGVHCFTLDPNIGEFTLTKPNMKIPDKAKYYSINESYENHWCDNTLSYIKDAKYRNLNTRWVGSLVADFHRNLIKGGIFLYPSDSSTERNNGKLRLLYEANPLAFIMKQAGGMATNGRHNILDITPYHIHEQTPLFLGCNEEMERLHNFLI